MASNKKGVAFYEAGSWYHRIKVLKEDGTTKFNRTLSVERQLGKELNRNPNCTLLLKSNFNPKAVSKLMGHARELITVDVYGDN